MDVRDVFIDGIEQLNDWLDDALKNLTPDQLNYLPGGKTTSIGFNAWHIMRTTDNITNFVFKKQPPIWLAKNYVERMNLPKVDQGTGMGLEDARAIKITDLGLLREYGAEVAKDCVEYLKTVDPATLSEVQMIKPLGEMPRWRVFRQVVMTHGFMHLGEVNALRGQLGLQFSI